MNSITITLPIPDACLSPNARCHWAVKHREAKKVRANAKLRTLAALGRNAAPMWNRAEVRINWYGRTATSRDGDNGLARCKSVMDGIADAGIVTNDRNFIYFPIKFGVDRKNPRLEIDIRPHGVVVQCNEGFDWCSYDKLSKKEFNRVVKAMSKIMWSRERNKS